MTTTMNRLHYNAMRLFTMIAAALMLAGCTKAHLDIFPDLEDPSLMDRPLTVNEMHQDIDAFIDGVMERHPSLSSYADLNEINQAKKEIKSQINKPLTRVEFYQRIGRLTHILNDGHSLLIWPYQEYSKLLEQGNKPFPFDVVINKQGKMYLKHSYQSDNKILKAGTEILTINGTVSSTLVERMQQQASGESQYLREQSVAMRIGTRLWSTFGYINDFKVDMITNTDNQAQNKIALTIKKDDQWEKMIESNQQEDHYYKVLSQGVGYLYLDHFDIDPSDFEDFIDESFKKIKSDKIHSLIIDIRNNPGGNTDTVTYLTQYIADKEFRMVSSVREKLNQDNRGMFNYRGEAGDILVEEWNDWYQPIDSENKFDGDSYLLISPVTYSAAIVLATSLQDNGFATLIGEPTGGYGNQTAQGNLFNLPHSKLRAYVATKTLVRPSGNTKRSFVTPDHLAYNSLDDVKAERDAGIERALDLIRQKQSSLQN